MSASNQAQSQQSDERDVRHLVLDAINRTQSDEFERFFELFTPEATWMLPSQVKDVGLDEAKRFYRFTEKFRFEQQVNIEEVQVFSDVAYARVTFDGFLVPKLDPIAPPIRSVSRHLWIIRKEHTRQWRLDRVIWNTPRPNDRVTQRA
ncbi:MAG: SgcJ/EcaC family oxidoreductase [Betaproteobacteria bacterium]|jgi:uncharacterized protein (TIGR02246 family)